jgi:transcriptional regulator with XRE-family HTH domain
MNQSATDRPSDLGPDMFKLRALGMAIREIRKAKGLSLQVVSDKAGKSVATLSRIEAGRQSVDVGTLMVLADILDFSAGVLLVKIQAQHGCSDLERRMWNGLRKILS